MKVLVVGYGAIGRRHVKNLLENTNLEIMIYTKRDDLDSLKRKNVKTYHSLEKCLSEKPDIGFITNDITGTASIEIGPANPPFPIPKTATPKAAKKKIDKSIITNF